MTTQKYREVEIQTALGADILLLKEATITEALNQPFVIDLQLLSRQEDIHFEALLGENATLRIEHPDGQPRYFNGHVSDFSQTGNEGDFAVYHATLRPWLWFLSQTRDCRIYQHKTVPEIIKDIFREQGFSDFEERLSHDYHTWNYRVLYRESYFNFVSRLMEQEGITYYFEHDNGRHTLILADNYASHGFISGHETLPYYPPNTASVRDENFISRWDIAKKLQSGRITLDDFAFERPKADLSARSSIVSAHAHSNYERFDYPGEFQLREQGEGFARTRMEALHSQYERIQGKSDVRALQAGALFKLDLHPREDQNREYLIVSVTHSILSDAYRSSDQSGSLLFTNTFTAIASETPYRPAQQTPKPRIQGPQTAIVVGPTGEEIYTDEYGRVKLQFHWDRYGQTDENASCWVRVSQAWAGKGWGGMTLPRIGQEVIVEFLEGDPDHPLVTGRVYNGDHRTPYKLPQYATRSGIKSQSSKGGGGFNELRFEDKKGEEQLFIHAERNLESRVKQDRLQWVGQDCHQIVKNDQFGQIGGDSHTTIQGDQNEKIGGTVSRDITLDLQEKIGNKVALEAGQDIHYKAGTNLVIEAGASITLKAGGGFITIGPEGVAISGVPVLINSGGAAGSGAGCSPGVVKLPRAADDGKPGKVRKPKKSESKQKKPLSTGSVQVGERQNSQSQASLDTSRQRQLEASIASKRVSPISMTDAQAILKQRRKELVKNGYKPKYTDEELLFLASKGEVNERYIVRIEWDKKPEDGLGYTRESGRAPIWTTTFDQLEHADSDPELITNLLGFDQPFSPDDKYKMYIIDQGEDFETRGDLSIIPSYEKLGRFSKGELGGEKGFNGALVDEVMTEAYSARYAGHIEDFKAQVAEPHMIFNKKRIEDFTASMSPEEKQMFKTRHLINTELGANPLYAGNGLTKPLDAVATRSNYGALEVFTFQKKPPPTGKLIAAGKLAKQPLSPLPKK